MRLYDPNAPVVAKPTSVTGTSQGGSFTGGGAPPKGDLTLDSDLSAALEAKLEKGLSGSPLLTPHNPTQLNSNI